MHVIQIHPRRRSDAKWSINTFGMKAWGDHIPPLKMGWGELNITDEAALHFSSKINPQFFVSKTYINSAQFDKETKILKTIQDYYYNEENKLPFTPILLESDKSINTNYISYCGSLLRGDVKEGKLMFGGTHIKNIVDDYDEQINHIFNTLKKLNIGCDVFSHNWKNFDADPNEHGVVENEYGLHRRGIEFTYDEYNKKLMIIDIENWTLSGEQMEIWDETQRLLTKL